ncbi:MAG: hypothetical protein ACPGVN_08540 [Alphaproteobacteria bacterium]
MYPEVPKKFLDDFASGGVLSTLEPVDDKVISTLVNSHKNISKQYVSFLSQIGVGSTKNESYIYLPYAAAELVEHPSFKIYNSSSSRRLFGLLPEKPVIPKNLVCVADCGASWRYCLDLSSGGEVYCLDMFGPTVDQESIDFFSFVDELWFSE